MFSLRCLRHLGTILSLTTHSQVVGTILSFSPHTQAQLSSSPVCSPQALGIPDLPNASILEIGAYPVFNHTAATIPLVHVSGGLWPNLNFCNVSISYTHPDFEDFVTITMWLPLEDWNGRFQGSGGAGWWAGLQADFLGPAVSEGYAVGSTDAGHDIYVQSAAPWALSTSGQVNEGLLRDFASIAQADLAVVGKQVIESFYGRPPRFSYWNGCSQGGRQGLSLAQTHPKAFDGIVAASPAIYWPQLLVAEFWPPQVMNSLGMFPEPCELEAIRRAGIQACDGVDGLVDGIISWPEQCNLDATLLVGQPYPCNGATRRFSNAATTVANAAWSGPIDSAGRQQWYGILPGTPFFNISDPMTPGLAGSTCHGRSRQSCTPAPFGLSSEWIQLFVAKNANFNLSSMTDDQYFDMLQASRQEFDPIMSTTNPDLSAFKARGGKMISWHGLTDQLVPSDGTQQYYDSVLSADPGAHDFYRFFKAPGVGHCVNGDGPLPSGALDAVVRWVEQGIAPDMLPAVSQNGDGTVRPQCPYPMRQQYVGGDGRDPTSFTCVSG